MVDEAPDGEDRPMTETSQEQDEQAHTGVASDNLRNYERLRRSTTDRKIAGVAGGLGRHLNIDPTVVRVLLVVMVFFGGSGLVLYGAAWLLVPEEGSEHSVVQTSPSTRNALLIVVGVFGALLLLGDAWNGFGFPWPLLVVGVVVLLLLGNRDRRRDRDRPDARPASTSAAYAPPSGPPAQQEWVAAPAPYQPPAPRPDRGTKLFGPTMAVIAVVLGSLGLYDVSAEVTPAAYAALALGVIGVMLLVGAFVGRPGGLILLGIVATIALAITSTVAGNWSSERRVDAAPLSAVGVADGYAITAGQIRLDLTDVRDLEKLDGRTIELSAEAGEIVVIVPDDVDVDVRADIRFGGEVDVDGYTRSGNDITVDRTLDGGRDVPQVNLSLDLLVGHIEVRQEDAA